MSNCWGWGAEEEEVDHRKDDLKEEVLSKLVIVLISDLNARNDRAHTQVGFSTSKQHGPSHAKCH